MRRTPLPRVGQMVASAAVLGVVAVLAGCGTPESDTVATPPAASGDEVLEGEGTFPVTVDHQFGSTTITEAPERVVSVGLTEQDVLLQLGVIPVGVTDWYGDQPDATWPWAHDLLGDAKPVVLSDADGIQFEKIVELDPDLIIGTNAGLTKRDYELLTDIAPTVTSVEGATAYFSSWQDQVLQVARALGREDDGRTLISRVEDDYAAVAAAHPEWEGLTGTFSQGAPYSGELYVYPDGLSTDFLTDLGFSITPGLEEFSPGPGEQAMIPAERTDDLEADVVLFATEEPANYDQLMKFGTLAQMPAVTENRSIYTDATLAGALYFITPLSLEYVLDRLPGLLEQAVAGEAPSGYPS